MTDQQNSDTRRPLSGRLERWVVIVTAVVGTLIAVAAYVFPRSADGETPVSTTVTAGTAAAAQPSRTGDGGPQDTAAPAPPDGTLLDTLGPVSGQSRLVALPATLAGSYARALAIACPSNEPKDLASEVQYNLNKGYAALVTTVTMYYEDTAPPADAELTVFQDSTDGRPGAPAAGPQTKLRLGVQDTKPLEAPVDRAIVLRLRLQCERPGGIAILNAPTLTSR